MMTVRRMWLEMKEQTRAAMSRGKRQYPRTLRLWKNTILPPCPAETTGGGGVLGLEKHVEKVEEKRRQGC